MADIFSVLDDKNFMMTTDFTDNALMEIRKTVESDEFDNMDAEMIRRHIRSHSGYIYFKDLMKRYIYLHSGETRPFASVTDDFYIRVILDSFAENAAPFRFGDSSRPNKKNVAKSLIGSDIVKRDTVFLAGFGLGMSDSDVSGFLTKGIHEQDFDFSDPRETIFYYCFRDHRPYADALKYMEYYRSAVPEGNGKAWEGMPAPGTEKELLSYLLSLKASGIHGSHQESAFLAFMRLVARAKEAIARIYQEDSGKPFRWQDIQDSALEDFLYSGVPKRMGNLAPDRESDISEYFHSHRLSRQRIDVLSRQKRPVDRFDLITLLFFVYSQDMLDEHPDERCRRFLDEINRILVECSMGKYYLANPYESFILMCLLTDTPLAAFSEVWEMSYSGS